MPKGVLLKECEMEPRIIKLNGTLSRRTRQLTQGLADVSAFSDYCGVIRSLNSSGPTRRLRLANGATLQSMKESLPQWPSLFGEFVLPSGPKHLLLNLWITDSQATTPIGMLPKQGLDWLCNSSRIEPRREMEVRVPQSAQSPARYRVSAKGFLPVRKGFPFALATFALVPLSTATSIIVSVNRLILRG